MNLKKLENAIGIMPIVTPESTEIINIDTVCTDLQPYTKNPELNIEIDKYKAERELSISALTAARNKVTDIVNTIADNVKIGDAKDIDAFAKIVNTLATLVTSLDTISNPSKVEIYIDPKQKQHEQKPEQISNTQNIFVGSPADLIKFMKENQSGESG